MSEVSTPADLTTVGTRLCIASDRNGSLPVPSRTPGAERPLDGR